MIRPLSVLTSFATMLGLMLVAPAGPAGSAVAAPVHAIDATGTGTTTYPSFSPNTSRYGVRTTADTGGVLTVMATTSDPGGRVFVDGGLATGPVEVDSLESGDEVSIIIRDVSGTSAYSYIYLPAEFPALASDGATDAAAQPGHTLMTLNPFSGVPARFMTAVDGNGVPAYVAPYTGNRHDFKRHDDGTFSVSQNVALPAGAGNVILELDEELQEVARRSTVGLTNTDFHDYLLSNGNRVMMAYEPRGGGSGLVDAVIQEIEPDGDVAFEWNSGDHIDIDAEAVGGGNDYAHINSVQVMSDGDYLLSMRHLSVVVKVARTARPGFEQGDIVWRLGGRLSDFDLSSDPLLGPCAQHTASEVTQPGGPTTIMVFDNGSFDNNPLCVDPNLPSGPAVGRAQSRVVEFVLDEEASPPTATVGRQYAPGRFAHFAGSAERLPNGNTLIGWTNNADGIATELDPSFNRIWELSSEKGYGSYRVYRAEVPDTSAPTADLSTPLSDAVYEFGQEVVADYGCTDRGGSGLQDCVGTFEEGSAVDTRAPGQHAFTVTAHDGAGNDITTTSTYTVLPDPAPAPSSTPTPTTPTTSVSTLPAPSPTTPVTVPDSPRPDAILVIGEDVIGNDEYGVRQRGRVRLTQRRHVRVVRVQIQNDGNEAASFAVAGPRSRRGVRITATLSGRDATGPMRRGDLRTPSLAPGQSITLRVTVRRTMRTNAPVSRVLKFSTTASGTSDVVQLKVRGS